ncbi:hypothetical protein Scep_020450 [Stephania cephalantha]|uniref:Uncharacterized protein n=1 Tax=Stephania cephalantha TaxID=152367 RepID=A0AAP0NQU1_9MAGN
MAVSFTGLPWWLFGAKEFEPSAISSASTFNSNLDLNLGLRESESVKITSIKGVKMPPALRKNKRKWRSREERRIDKEFDMVMVPSDGGCLSGSESEDSDWSIGWLEPHAPDFQSEDETESSFAVLVRCYRHGCKEIVDGQKNQILGAIVDITNGFSTDADGEKYMQQWLSSLQTADI